MRPNPCLTTLVLCLSVLLCLGASSAALADSPSGTARGCSYDGSALVVNANALTRGGAAAARSVVSEIMRYTGLPQNFEVTEGDVPNAAAVILRGPDGLPVRIIAYNRRFMDQVRTATANNDWAPISIMAHEIGHHLAGHTILPGGSQPPTELEADKFSGFVLFKMGARQKDAVVAMETLVPDRDSPTHPRRSKRVAAIESGWREACQQQGDCDAAGRGLEVAASSPNGRSPAASPPAPAGSLAPAPAPPAAEVAQTPLPKPDRTSTPRKFDRFMVDEVGLLDPEVGERLAADLYRHAEEHGVEILVALTESLDGRSATDYGYDLMRQLRVGKLEVGNGAVLVLAPGENEVGVALGSGLLAELGDRTALIESPLRAFLDNHDRCASCPKVWSTSVADACDRIIRDTKSWEWSVRYGSLGELLSADAEETRRRRESGGRSDALRSATWRKLVRVSGTVAATPAADAQKRTVPSRIPAGGRAIEVVTDDGESLVVYVDPHVEALMPLAMQAGARHSMVLRAVNLHLLNFQLISFDRS